MSVLKRASGRWATAILALTCATSWATTRKPAEENLAWPPNDPRVRLERVIELESRGGAGKLIGWLSGKKQASLFERPYGVAWIGDDLLVTDPGAKRVLRISPGGHVIRSREGTFLNPIGVTTSPGGIIVSDAATGKVALLAPNLDHVRWISEGLSRPTGVAWTGDALVVVETGEHRLLLVASDGDRKVLGSRGAGPGEFNFPTSVTSDSESLWVGDTLNFRVQKLRSDGATEGFFGRLGDAPGEMPRVKGVAVDVAGHVWVSDAYLDQVSLYETDGTLLMSLGGTGAEPGKFSFPAGIASRLDGRVAVVDSLNRRVQIFRLIARSESPQ